MLAEASPALITATPTLSGQTIKHSSGMDVPEELYDWPV